MERFIMEEHLFAFDILGDYVDSAWLAEEPLWRGIAVELEASKVLTIKTC